MQCSLFFNFIRVLKLIINVQFLFLMNLVFSSFHVFCTSSHLNTSDAYFISESEPEEKSYPYINHDIVGGSEIIEFLCIGNAECVRLSKCLIMVQLLDRSCLQTNKLHELTCGYTDGEPMVCCPKQNSISNLPSRPTITPSTVKPTASVFPHEQSCGVPHLYNWQANNYRGIGSQPWVVRVGFKNKVTGLMEHPCCGSIIGPRVILTTAHCALRKPETLRIVSVRVGEYDTSHNPDCTQTFCALPIQDVPLAHVVVHPGYSPKNYRHNVALLVLKNPLNYSVTVQPVCLHQSHSPLEGRRAKLVGWGKLPGDSDMRKRQQQLELPVVNLERCKRIYAGAVALNDNELCVGGEEGKDACSGFGGAPLVLLRDHSHPQYTQIGIVSFGSERCGVEGIPSVYVRVDQYVEWIKLNSPQE